MKYFVGALIIAGLLALPFACGKYDALYNRTVGTEVGKSIADKDREVFKTSKSYIENSIQTLHNYKMQYDLADEEDKKIIANNIRSEFASFNANHIENPNLRYFLLDIQGGNL